VKKDLREWTLSKVIWVADVQDNLQVKEVRLGDDDHDRFIICFNPGQAERDAAIRAKLTAQLEELIDGTDALTAAEPGKIEGSLASRPGLERFLRVTPGGLLRTGKAKIAAEENLDGTYLLRCSDPHMTTEDIALGYKQLLEVERGWKDMKQVIDLRPVYHRREDRIRAHVILCWLALLLMRVAENTAERPWNRIRAELQRQHAVTWTGPTGAFRQTTDLTKPLRDLYTTLSIEPPKKILALDPAPSTFLTCANAHRLVTRPVTGHFGVPAARRLFFGH
jgi:transposase